RVSFSSTLVNRLKELQKLYNNLLDLGIQKDKLIFDLGETTGLNYYTGLKFSFINKNTGGSLISGGRYDNLMEKFGLKLSACGIAFNIEEILSLYETEDEKIGIDYLVVGKNNFKKAEEFRKKGFKVLWVSDNDKIENLDLLYQIKNIIS
ncbi:MAG: ATP phosphoribosyltransferase regulatory subunit, partial [Deferribacterales bacterium]|nr:ATP phosphoribosyltransferase regulatory subunit [Deferribacterales bacterium]